MKVTCPCGHWSSKDCFGCASEVLLHHAKNGLCRDMNKYTSKISYSGHKETLEVTIGWRELEVIVDAIKDYEKKYEYFDDATEETFNDLKYIHKENWA